jgi:hypothetical protein
MIETRSTKMERGMPRKLVGTTTLGLALGFGLGCDGQADPRYEGEPLVSVSGGVEAELSMGDVEVGILWLTAESDFDLMCTGEVETSSGEPSACVAACGEVTCEDLESWGDCASNCADVTNIFLDARVPALIGGVGQTTPAIGEFPAQFSLDILEPPPAEALIGSATGERLAIGVFVALDPAGAPWRIDLTRLPAYPDWLLGGSESHVLLYAPDAIPAASTWFQVLQHTLAPGYHLMEVLPAAGDACEDERGSCEGDGAGVREVIDGDASSVRLIIAPPGTIRWPIF